MADSNSLTLADYALLSNSPLIQKISKSMLMQGNVLQDIPLMTYQSMIANGTRFIGTQGNATPAFRALNAAPAVTKGLPTPYSEQAYIMSNNFDIDNVLLQDKNSIQDPFAVQLSHYFDMVTYKLNDIFVNNDHIAGDVNAPVGLKFRLDNNTLYGIPSEMKIDAAGVDLRAGANGPKLCLYLDTLLDYMGDPEGTGICLYMNMQLRRLINFAIKTAGTAGGFRTTEDAFGRQVTMYRNAKMRTIGRKADQSTDIISAAESAAGAGTAGGAGTSYTSIYGVRYGDGFFKGWQFRGLEEAVTGPYLLTATGTQQQITFDWPVGLWQEHTRCVGRVYDILVA